MTAESKPGQNDRLTSYAELADVLGHLPLLVKEARRARGLSQRATAEQIGISYSVVSRLENGQDDLRSTSLAATLRWLDLTGPAPVPVAAPDEEERGDE